MPQKVYPLVLKDFAPLKGMIRYAQRCGWEALSEMKPDGEDYKDYIRQCSFGKAVLIAYNTVVFGGVSTGLFFGIKGLVGLVSR